jgi:hypothetical protein
MMQAHCGMNDVATPRVMEKLDEALAKIDKALSTTPIGEIEEPTEAMIRAGQKILRSPELSRIRGRDGLVSDESLSEAYTAMRAAAPREEELKGK